MIKLNRLFLVNLPKNPQGTVSLQQEKVPSDMLEPKYRNRVWVERQCCLAAAVLFCREAPEML